MSRRFNKMHGKQWILAFSTAFFLRLRRQIPGPSNPRHRPPSNRRPPPAGKHSPNDNASPETHITPEQAKELFGLVDELLKFSSQETGLPIKSDVKRQITTRAAVEKYLTEKFNEDEDARRMQRSEIVLKKFGLLDRDFDLKPFLLALLKEQIEAYYDPKTKTVNMLDWIGVDEQKPVLAHELTHALQDQHTDLEKWSDQTPARRVDQLRQTTQSIWRRMRSTPPVKP